MVWKSSASPWDAIQRYRRVEPGVADVREAFNPLSSVNDAGHSSRSTNAFNSLVLPMTSRRHWQGFMAGVHDHRRHSLKNSQLEHCIPGEGMKSRRCNPSR